MKKKISYLALILFAFTFTFCNDDDDPKPDLPDEIVDSKTYSTNSVISKDAFQKQSITIELTDFTKVKEYINYIKYDSDILTDSKFSIKGMSQNEGAKLENLVLKLKEVPSISYTIGDVSADKEVKTGKYIDFNGKLLYQLIKRKKITIDIEYSSPTGIETPITFEQYWMVEFELD